MRRVSQFLIQPRRTAFLSAQNKNGHAAAQKSSLHFGFLKVQAAFVLLRALKTAPVLLGRGRPNRAAFRSGGSRVARTGGGCRRLGRSRVPAAGSRRF